MRRPGREMPPSPEPETAVELLARLLADRDFRARFRQDPAAVCLEYGLADAAVELGGPGKALYTLELRESRSSLAGALVAAAGEGASAVESLRQLGEQAGHQGETARVIHEALATSPPHSPPPSLAATLTLPAAPGPAQAPDVAEQVQAAAAPQQPEAGASSPPAPVVSEAPAASVGGTPAVSPSNPTIVLPTAGGPQS